MMSRMKLKMKNNSKKNKAVKLPETEKEDKPLDTPENIKKAQDFARSVSPLTLALFEAKSERKKNKNSS